MNDQELEARLRAWYGDEVGAAETAPGSLRRDVAAIPRTASNRSRRFGRGPTLLAAAALLLVGGALAAGSGLVRQLSLVPPEPSLAADATPSPAKESPRPTAVTSPARTSSAVTELRGAWIATGSMGVPRSEHTAVRLLDGRVLVVGGDDQNDLSAELYDPDSGTWSATGSMIKPHARGFPATLLRDGKVLVGQDVEPGTDPSASGIMGAEVYDPASGTWTATEKMVTVVREAIPVLLRNGKVLVVHPDSAELYDPDTGTWSATGKMNTPGLGNGAPVLLPDGTVLVAGGGIYPKMLDSAELYDPDTGSWTVIANMNAQRDGITATLLGDGTVFVAGPTSSSTFPPSTSAELYDPATGAWTVTGDMVWTDISNRSAILLPDGKVFVSSDPGPQLYDPGSGTWTITATTLRPHINATATLLLDGTVLVAGGEESGSAELYIPAGVSPPAGLAFTPPAGVWIATGAMGAPRYGHTAVRLLDGRVLVVGGSSEGEHNLTSTELYDPATGTWSATGSMVRPHGDGFPATLLRDGRVLMGDLDGGAELYDPATGTWTVTGKMLGYGYSHSATLLADGKVLVAHNGDRAELYDPATGTWTATGKMTTWGDYREAVLLRDGRVLLAGGTVKSAELYDPATGTWAASADMKTWRNPIALTLLSDGKVLVTGGDGSEWMPPDLYDPVTGAWTPTEDYARPGAHYGSETLLADGMVLVTGALDAELYDPGTGSWTVAGSMLREHDSPLTLLLDGTVLVAGGNACLNGVCVATGSAELYVAPGVSPPVGLPAAPDPTPIPTPTPTPTPVPPQAGPVPPGARSWKVTVVNDSSRPATLFVAEEDSTGMTRLVGSVTPNVVPAGATVEVTFRLPAKGVEGWWIFVNPGPDNGALLAGTDVPRAGEIRITADGQVGWLSP